MMAMAGFPVGFDTTKGKAVKGNSDGITSHVGAHQYRQYMNRRSTSRLIEGGRTRS